MMTTNMTAALLAASALAGLAAVPAGAATKSKAKAHHAAAPSHDAELRALIEAQQAKIDALSAQVSAMSAAPAPSAVSAEEQAARDEAAANSEFLKAQVDALQAQLEVVKADTKQNAPTWSGNPQWKGPGGFSFKPSGEIQYDAGYISNPKNAIPGANLGFNNRARRLLLGANGDLPGDFKYSFQFDFAQAAINYEDIVFSYEPKNKPYTVTLGYFYPYNSLDNLTSNRFVSVVERNQAVDAFGQGRRLGIGFGYTSGDFRLNGGVFANQINNAAFDNNDWELAGRILYAPLMGNTQLHFAVNGEYRRFKTTSLGIQYRSRPFTQITDQRFVDAGAIAAKGDYVIGLEALAIHGPFHIQGEAKYVKTDGYRPGDGVGNGAIDPGQVLNGTLLASDPSFFSAYGEVGFWLTGETRGYKNFKIDRTKILNGFDKGGWGGFNLVGRVDYIDLKDTVGGPNTGTQVINGVLNGGQQTGFLLALNWWPIDYVRFTAQYIHDEIKGGPRAGLVKPISSQPIYNRKFSTDGVVLRGQVDF